MQSFLLNACIAVIFCVLGIIAHEHYMLNKCETEGVVALDNTPVFCQVHK